MREACYDCHIKTVEDLIGKFKPATAVADRFRKASQEYLLSNSGQSNPLIATGIHRLASRIMQQSDLYQEEKSALNSLLLGHYEYFKRYLKKQKDPLYMAAKLAVIGNIIDYGAHSVPADIKEEAKRLLGHPLKIDETRNLFEAIQKAESILYIGDNAGEIVFDKLFIEFLEHPGITYAVRGKPVINDVTFRDAYQVGINEFCQLIHNGDDAPSTLLENCSKDFVRKFNESDLVIAKGQGNFEGLMHSSHPNLFFMLMAKCSPIAELLNTDPGSMIIMKNNRADCQTNKFLNNGL